MLILCLKMSALKTIASTVYPEAFVKSKKMPYAIIGFLINENIKAGSYIVAQKEIVCVVGGKR